MIIAFLAEEMNSRFSRKYAETVQIRKMSSRESECVQTLREAGHRVLVFRNTHSLFAQIRLVNPDVVLCSLTRNNYERVEAILRNIHALPNQASFSSGILTEAPFVELGRQLQEQGIIDIVIHRTDAASVRAALRAESVGAWSRSVAQDAMGSLLA